jgi:hypothetical protein
VRPLSLSRNSAARQLVEDFLSRATGVAMDKETVVAVAQRQCHATTGAGTMHRADAPPPCTDREELPSTAEISAALTSQHRCGWSAAVLMTDVALAARL